MIALCTMHQLTIILFEDMNGMDDGIDLYIKYLSPTKNP